MCLVKNHGEEVIAYVFCDKYGLSGLIVTFFGTIFMSKIQEMSSFAAVVEAGSFVAAADVTGLSKTAVSRHISNLEQRLGVRLLQRTTRRLSLTDEGRTFFTRVKDVLGSIDEAESELTARSVEPSGLVRVNAPLTFGTMHLAPLWGPFMDANPKVSLEITLSDRAVDLVEEGYDLAVRIATSPGSNVVSRKLASTKLYCAHHLAISKSTAPRDILAIWRITHSSLIRTGPAEMSGASAARRVQSASKSDHAFMRITAIRAEAPHSLIKELSCNRISSLATIYGLGRSSS